MKDKTNTNIGSKKRRTSPQIRLFNSLLNSFELKKSNQSLKIFDSLNNSKKSEFMLNSVSSKINQTSNEILKYKFKKDNILTNKTNIITNHKHTRHKKYIRICLESTSNMNNSIEKNQSTNTISNLAESYTHNGWKKIKKNIELPINYSNTNYISRNKKSNDINKRFQRN